MRRRHTLTTLYVQGPTSRQGNRQPCEEVQLLVVKADKARKYVKAPTAKEAELAVGYLGSSS